MKWRRSTHTLQVVKHADRKSQSLLSHALSFHHHIKAERSLGALTVRKCSQNSPVPQLHVIFWAKGNIRPSGLTLHVSDNTNQPLDMQWQRSLHVTHDPSLIYFFFVEAGCRHRCIVWKIGRDACTDRFLFQSPQMWFIVPVITDKGLGFITTFQKMINVTAVDLYYVTYYLIQHRSIIEVVCKC